MSHEKEVQQLIDVDKLNRISDFITKSSHSDFVKKRQMVMMALLAFSGARPSELVGLSIDSIKCSPNPSQTVVRIPAVKHSKGVYKFRLVTISTSFAQALVKYIEYDRNRIISETCGIKNDTRALLINEKTGLSLNSRDLSQEISKISKETGIDIRISTNLFRRQYSSLFTHKLNSLNGDKIFEQNEADRFWQVNRYMSKYYVDHST